MEDDVLSFLDDDADIPVISKGTKRTIQGGSFVSSPAAVPPPSGASAPSASGAPAARSMKPPSGVSAPRNLILPSFTASAPATVTPPTAVKGPSRASFDLAGQLEQDKKDVTAAAARVESHTDVPGTVALHSQLDTMLDAAIAESGITLANSDLSARYHAVARTFFRGLRDPLETASKLTMPVVSGGLGMSDADAEKVMAVLGKKLSLFQGALTKEKEMEKQKFVAKQAVKHLDAQKEQEREAKDVLDAKFNRLTGKDRENGVRPSPMPVGRSRSIAVTSLDEERPKDLPSMEDILLSTSSSTIAPAASSPLVPVPPAAASPVIASEATQSRTFSADQSGLPRQAEYDLPRNDKPSPLPKLTPAMVTPPLDHPLPNPDQPKVAPPPPDLPLLHEDSVIQPAKKAASAAVIASEATQSRPFGADQSGLPRQAGYSLPRNDKPSPPQPPPLVVPSRPAVMPVPPPVAPQAPSRQQAPQAPSTTGARPVVADVKQPKGATLMGPIEELQSFSLVDFRRLSKDSRERTLKIKDKIDLLEDQSFSKKTEGISAWHLSPVNRLYLDMLRKSLEGKPVVDVIALMEAGGQDVLAKDEFDAIMDLNRTLRFG